MDDEYDLGLADQRADTPPLDDVLENEPDRATIQMDPVPVVTQGPVRVEQLPTVLSAATHRVLPVGSSAVRLLGDDLKRKRLTITAANNDIMIGASQAIVDQFKGAVLFAGVIVPLHFEFHSELWARPVAVDTTGTAIAFAASADAALVSLVVEQWAR